MVKKIKYGICLLFLTLFTVCFTMVACGRREDVGIPDTTPQETASRPEPTETETEPVTSSAKPQETEPDISTEPETEIDKSYQTDFLEFEVAAYEAEGAIVNGNLLIVKSFQYDFGRGDKLPNFLAVDMTTGKSTVIVPESIEEQRSVQEIIAYQDGYLAVVYRRDGWQTAACLVRYDADFNVVSETSLDGFKGNSKPLIRCLAADEDGNIYFTYENAVYVFDGQGNELCRMESNCNPQEIVTAKDGRVFMAGSDMADGTLGLFFVDAESGTIGEPLVGLPSLPDGLGNGICPAESGKFYLRSSEGLYLYDVDSQSYEEVLDWLSCNVDTSDIMTKRLSTVAVMEDGSIVAVLLSSPFDSDDGPRTGIELAVVREASADNPVQKKTITLAMMRAYSDVKGAIAEFNRYSEEYRIELKTYLDGDVSAFTDDNGHYNEEYEKAFHMFCDDIASGEADFFYLDGIENNPPLDVLSALAEKGAAADLTELIETDDTLKTEDFVANILDAMSVDGKLYGINTGFHVDTLMGKTEDVGNGRGWTFTEALELMKAHSDVQFIQDASQEYLFRKLLEHSLYSFYDSGTGECFFDSDEFIALLEMCRIASEENVNDGSLQNAHRLPEQLRNGEVLMYEVWLNLLSDIQVYGKIYDSEINVIGYPTASGFGTTAEVVSVYGICSRSENKEGAWKFIRQFFLPEYQKMYSTGYIFPMNRNVLEERIEQMAQNTSERTYTSGGITVEQTKPTEEEIQAFRNIIYGIREICSVDNALLDLVVEEASYYFDGKRSAEETASVIQSRAQIYLNEKNKD